MLVWEGSHPRAVELVLIVEDPDAPSGPFTHWLVAGLEPDSGSTDSGLPDGAAEGTNDFGRIGWAGPNLTGHYGRWPTVSVGSCRPD